MPLKRPANIFDIKFLLQRIYDLQQNQSIRINIIRLSKDKELVNNIKTLASNFRNIEDLMNFVENAQEEEINFPCQAKKDKRRSS